ncbi:MAG: adenylosuccinate synthase [Bacteroidia bacterium]|nr:adenylosuccinate synthase [Bacteroidia bacterium]MBP7261846.1 adenylosuccinate synthase [Bacteroidia bacterium]MBP9179083.1 adenylosuccinate synthase [Bacteroidia bacterium]MBP9725459.1 adenylosuccinate synthase [Bacteroidia bacterium]
MKVDVLLGLQWGDEGKGKIADFITPKYDIVARFQGGPNAGHSLEINGMKHVLNTIPSGIFHPNCINLIGSGVVVDPVKLQDEITKLYPLGVDVKKNLYLSKRAHLILPTHRLLDAASELSKGDNKIGSTLRGISPAYQDKTGRSGLRIGDIQLGTFQAKYNEVKQKHLNLLGYYGYDLSISELDKMEADWFASIEFLREYVQVDSEYYINNALVSGKKILAEGAQGSMLDIDFGTYPYVTSSNTITAGACTGLGLAPGHIGKVYGIFKAYCTRVGGGPFPSELNDSTGEEIRKIGHEFGATTGRPRRTGWIDLVALKYAIMLNGVTNLFITKSDVLSGFDEIKACTSYKVNDIVTPNVPYEICDGSIEPLYDTFKGWKEDITRLTSMDEMPQELTGYLNYLEQQLTAEINILSVGPDRDQTIIRKPF